MGKGKSRIRWNEIQGSRSRTLKGEEKDKILDCVAVVGRAVNASRLRSEQGQSLKRTRNLQQRTSDATREKDRGDGSFQGNEKSRLRASDEILHLKICPSPHLLQSCREATRGDSRNKKRESDKDEPYWAALFPPHTPPQVGSYMKQILRPGEARRSLPMRDGDRMPPRSREYVSPGLGRLATPMGFSDARFASWLAQVWA